jgi:serine/threonine protein kinase
MLTAPDLKKILKDWMTVHGADKIGEGGFAIVFVTKDWDKMKTILSSKMFQRIFMSEKKDVKDALEKIKKGFDNHHPYVIKINLKVNQKDRCGEIKKHLGWLSTLSPQNRERVLCTELCGSMRLEEGLHDEITFEIQQYGGIEFFDFLSDYHSEWKHEYRKVMRATKCLFDILVGLLKLIKDSNVMITDLKPENMVVNVETGEISLIDLEFFPLGVEEHLDFVPTMTMYPDLVPPQFYNSIFYSNSNNTRQHYKNHYLERVQKQIGVEQKEDARAIMDALQGKVFAPEQGPQVASFYSVWVMFHIMYEFLAVVSGQAVASAFKKNFLVPLKRNRLKTSIKNMMLALRVFISQIPFFYPREVVTVLSSEPGVKARVTVLTKQDRDLLRFYMEKGGSVMILKYLSVCGMVGTSIDAQATTVSLDTATKQSLLLKETLPRKSRRALSCFWDEPLFSLAMTLKPLLEKATSSKLSGSSPVDIVKTYLKLLTPLLRRVKAV